MRDARQIAIEARAGLDLLSIGDRPDRDLSLTLIEALALLLAGDAETATEPAVENAPSRPEFQAPKDPKPRPKLRGQ